MIYSSCIYTITLIITKYEIQQNMELFAKVSSIESDHKQIVISKYPSYISFYIQEDSSALVLSSRPFSLRETLITIVRCNWPFLKNKKVWWLYHYVLVPEEWNHQSKIICKNMLHIIVTQNSDILLWCSMLVERHFRYEGNTSGKLVNNAG